MSGRVTLRDARSVLVRDASPADAPAISSYIAQLATNAPYIGMTPGETPTPDKVRERIAELDERPGSVGLLAEAGGEVVGDCWLMAMPRVKMRHVGQIGMAIADGWRGVGLGRALLERVIERGRESEHLWRIELGVLHENAPAIALYESLGFAREGYYPGRFRQLDGALLDDIIMGMWVGPGDQRPR